MSAEQYLTEIIKDLELAFWDERGLGARYRTTLVGVKYFQEKFGKELAGAGWKETVEKVLAALVQEGVIQKGTFEGQGNVLTVEFAGCMHLGIEKSLAEKGIRPFSCPCANVVMSYIDALVGASSELVSIDVKENSCRVIFGIVGSTLEEV